MIRQRMTTRKKRRKARGMRSFVSLRGARKRFHQGQRALPKLQEGHRHGVCESSCCSGRQTAGGCESAWQAKTCCSTGSSKFRRTSWVTSHLLPCQTGRGHQLRCSRQARCWSQSHGGVQRLRLTRRGRGRGSGRQAGQRRAAGEVARFPFAGNKKALGRKGTGFGG